MRRRSVQAQAARTRHVDLRASLVGLDVSRAPADDDQRHVVPVRTIRAERLDLSTHGLYRAGRTVFGVLRHNAGQSISEKGSRPDDG